MIRRGWDVSPGAIPIRLAWAVGIMMACALPARSENWGFKLGVASSDQTTNDKPGPIWGDLEADLGFAGGVLVGLPWGRWRIVPSVSYIDKADRRGVSFYESTSNGYTQVAVSGDFKYVSAATDVHLTFPLGDANFYFLVAPRVDFLTTQNRSRLVETWGDDPPDVTVPPFESVVWGAGIGVGQDIQVGRHTLFLEARYDRDLSAAWQAKADWGLEGAGTQSVFNRSFIFQLGFRLFTSTPEDETSKAAGWLPVNPPR